MSHVGIVAVLLQLACSSAPPPPPTPPPGAEGALRPTRILPAEYRLVVGDELRVSVLGSPDLNGVVTLGPDGMISPIAAGEILAANRTVPEITAELRERLGRILRYPDVSVMLNRFADQMIYVLGEVNLTGSHRYVPNMTALHALAAARGPKKTGRLSNVLVLRRTGPSELDVYKVNLEAPLDGDVHSRDMFLEPYDIVFIPRSIIGEINKFVELVFRENISALYFYSEGWRAFHMDRLNYVTNK